MENIPEMFSPGLSLICFGKTAPQGLQRTLPLASLDSEPGVEETFFFFNLKSGFEAILDLVSQLIFMNVEFASWSISVSTLRRFF